MFIYILHAYIVHNIYIYMSYIIYIYIIYIYISYWIFDASYIPSCMFLRGRMMSLLPEASAFTCIL